MSSSGPGVVRPPPWAAGTEAEAEAQGASGVGPGASEGGVREPARALDENHSFAEETCWAECDFRFVHSFHHPLLSEDCGNGLFPCTNDPLQRH